MEYIVLIGILFFIQTKWGAMTSQISMLFVFMWSDFAPNKKDFYALKKSKISPRIKQILKLKFILFY